MPRQGGKQQFTLDKEAREKEEKSKFESRASSLRNELRALKHAKVLGLDLKGQGHTEVEVIEPKHIMPLLQGGDIFLPFKIALKSVLGTSSVFGKIGVAYVKAFTNSLVCRQKSRVCSPAATEIIDALKLHILSGSVLAPEMFYSAADKLTPELQPRFESSTLNGYLGSVVMSSFEVGFLPSVHVVLHGSLHLLLCGIKDLIQLTKKEDAQAHLNFMNGLTEKKLKELVEQKIQLYHAVISPGEAIVTTPGFANFVACANLEHLCFVRQSWIPKLPNVGNKYQELQKSILACCDEPEKPMQQDLFDILSLNASD